MRRDVCVHDDEIARLDFVFVQTTISAIFIFEATGGKSARTETDDIAPFVAFTSVVRNIRSLRTRRTVTVDNFESEFLRFVVVRVNLRSGRKREARFLRHVRPDFRHEFVFGNRDVEPANLFRQAVLVQFRLFRVEINVRVEFRRVSGNNTADRQSQIFNSHVFNLSFQKVVRPFHFRLSQRVLNQCTGVVCRIR